MSEGIAYCDKCDCAIHACVCRKEVAMSEDKMREEHWRQWGIAGMPKDKIRLAEETWKTATEACAAIKDAEISQLKTDNADLHKNLAESNELLAAANKEIADLKTRLSGRTCFIPPEFQKQLDDAHAEIAARDLMIKELREALLELHTEALYQAKNGGWDNRYEIPKAEQALAKSEHHNYCALEIKLLEARIDGFKLADGLNDRAYANTAAHFEAKLAELNKE